MSDHFMGDARLEVLYKRTSSEGWRYEKLLKMSELAK